MKFLQEQGYKIEFIWEYQYHKEKQSNKALQAFLQSRRLPFRKKFTREVTTKQILESVLDEVLFGFLEVSLEVPDTFEKSLIRPNTNLLPYEYFSEFSPIFCTTKVPFECIGEHMQNFAKQNNLSQKPRTLLVGGMKTEKNTTSYTLVKMVSRAWPDCHRYSWSNWIWENDIL